MVHFSKLRPEHQTIRESLIQYVVEQDNVDNTSAEEIVYTLERAVNMLKQVSDKRYRTIYECNDITVIKVLLKKIEKDSPNVLLNKNAFEGKMQDVFQLYYDFLGDKKAEEELKEGEKVSKHIEGFERNPKARRICLEYYGYKCQVCGFDFEKMYGEIGKGFIEVHHINPLSNIDESHTVDPIKDLAPLCSNCHSMIHREISMKNKPILPSEFRSILESLRTSRDGVELWQRHK